ncbi:YbaN family protein [Pseudoalteromonas luteoviolacea]|uniref:YbaN family protein n=1 Tax=Pseudoalteromonas luteoviolacea TaxID=43657 RepID=UPI001F2EEB44|nr:YbaN family protein [Pseudoalteromonas luteoviolacea]MCF6440916.1 YbaN family protein [Pseudoalteromonas luteoviolacea]
MRNQKMRMSRNIHHNVVKYAYLFGGIISLGLALIGAILPIMPTTVFLIIALWCFSKSSARLEHWLLTHPKFGHILSNWQKHQIVPKPAKFFAAAGMSASLIISGLLFSFGWLQVALFLLFAFICNYLFAKPSNPNSQGNSQQEKRFNIALSAASCVLLCYWFIVEYSPTTY